MGVSGVVETSWGLELTKEGLSVGGMDRGEGEVNLKGIIAFIEYHLGFGPRSLPHRLMSVAAKQSATTTPDET